MPCFLQALARLIETDEAAKQGQHQFLSGLLYNLAKVLAADQPLPSPLTQLQAAGYSCGELCLHRCSATCLFKSLLLWATRGLRNNISGPTCKDQSPHCVIGRYHMLLTLSGQQPRSRWDLTRQHAEPQSCCCCIASTGCISSTGNTIGHRKTLMCLQD